jgi:hypothetical protein
MIRITSQSKLATPAWHEVFLRLLPAIRQHARISFRHLTPERREDCIEEAICNACCAVARLAELNKLDLAYAGPLARYGVAQVRDGRKVGCRLNIKDVLSPYCQKRKEIIVERLDKFDDEENQWMEAVVEDLHTPVFDQVQFRCDFPAWLGTLRRRDRRIAETLAVGNRTQDVARKFKVSEGRISQLRRELAESWAQFVGDNPTDAN